MAIKIVIAAIWADECVWLFTFSLSNSHIRVGTLFGLFTVIHNKNFTKEEAEKEDDEENTAILGGGGGDGVNEGNNNNLRKVPRDLNKTSYNDERFASVCRINYTKKNIFLRESVLAIICVYAEVLFFIQITHTGMYVNTCLYTTSFSVSLFLSVFFHVIYTAHVLDHNSRRCSYSQYKPVHFNWSGV